MANNKHLVKYLLKLGDSALIHGQRLSEWCSRGPFLEEDLAITNMSLDNIGRAQALLKYAGELSETKESEDDLAFKRGEREFYNLLLTELPIGDFAYTMAKQMLLSSFEYFQFTELSKSSDETIAGISQKAIKEVRYHLEHSKDWCVRLGNGTDESKMRLQNAFNDLWMFTGEFFETNDTETDLIASKIAVNSTELESKWKEMVAGIMKESNMEIPTVSWMQTGSQQGIHTEHLGHLLSEMQYLQRAYPDAKW